MPRRDLRPSSASCRSVRANNRFGNGKKSREARNSGDPPLSPTVRKRFLADLAAEHHRLLAIAVNLVSYYRWSKDLTIADAAEELLQEAVFRTLDSKRNWDPDAVGVVPFLAQVMKSKISDDARTAALHKKKEALVADELQRQTAADDALHIAALCDGFAARVLRAADGDPTLEAVAVSLADGVWKPAVIAKETGLTEKQVYEAKRKLDRRMASSERNNDHSR